MSFECAKASLPAAKARACQV